MSVEPVPVDIDDSLIRGDDSAPYVKAVADRALALRPHIRVLRFAPSLAVDPATDRLTGYEAAVDGAVPADRIFHPGVAQTVVAYDVVGGEDVDPSEDGAHPYQLNEAAVRRRFASGPIQMYEKYPGVDVGLFRTQDGLDNAWAVVARGNNQRAVEAFLGSQGDLGKRTLDEVMTAKDGPYRRLTTSSRAHVANAARAWAEAHGLRVGHTPSVSQQTNTVSVDVARSKDAPGASGTARRVYTVREGVVDASTSHGGVLVFRGPLAGYREFRGTKRSGGEGNLTYSWSNDHGAIMPADTGRWHAAAGRPSDYHPQASDRMAKLADARLRWDGPIPAPPPARDARYFADDDVHADWAAKLKAKTGASVRNYDTVVHHVAGLDPIMFTPEQAVKYAGEDGLAYVQVGSGVPEKLVRMWPKVAAKVGLAPNALAAQFADQSEDGRFVRMNVDVVKTVMGL